MATFHSSSHTARDYSNFAELSANLGYLFTSVSTFFLTREKRRIFEILFRSRRVYLSAKRSGFIDNFSLFEHSRCEWGSICPDSPWAELRQQTHVSVQDAAFAYSLITEKSRCLGEMRRFSKGRDSKSAIFAVEKWILEAGEAIWMVANRSHLWRTWPDQ